MSQIESQWTMWGRKDSCDTWCFMFSELERLAVRSMIESGESFVIMHRKQFGRSKVPFRIRGIEADQLDEDYKGKLSDPTNVWRLGIEMDRFQRAVNYAFLLSILVIVIFLHLLDKSNILLCQQKM